jgi:hypothetical protein
MADQGDVFTFENLGGGQEVGRSCHILQFKGKCVMVQSQQATLMSSLTQEFIQETLGCQHCPSTIRST